MKYGLLMSSILSLSFCTPVHAEEVKANIVDKYKTVTNSTPTTQRICFDVEVPIYGNTGNGASAGDVLGGMIIGGILGKGISGNDQGAAAGAVLGGMVSADKKQNRQQIVGYRIENRCRNETTYTTETREVYSHSEMSFSYNGYVHTLRFQK